MSSPSSLLVSFPPTLDFIYLPPHLSTLSSVKSCLWVALLEAHLYLWLGVQSYMNPVMAGQRSPYHAPVLEMIIIPENLWTHRRTHRGDILECYCKGVVSYPQYKVIWSYTPEGNTLINSSTCSQTWPCLSPTHTYTHTFRAEQQRFSRIHFSLKVLIQNTEQRQKHLQTLKRASHWETNSVKIMKGRFFHKTRTWWQVWSISLQFQVFAHTHTHTHTRAKYTHILKCLMTNSRRDGEEKIWLFFINLIHRSFGSIKQHIEAEISLYLDRYTLMCGFRRLPGQLITLCTLSLCVRM